MRRDLAPPLYGVAAAAEVGFGPPDSGGDIAALHAEVVALRERLAVREERDADYVGRRDGIHDRVHEVVKDVLNGRVMKEARDQLGDALKRAPEDKRSFPVLGSGMDPVRFGGFGHE